MPVQLTHFDDVALPIYNPQQQHDPAGVDTTLLPSIGGIFDPYGSSQARAQAQRISITGVVWGEMTYIVDEAGDLLVDETGNYVIAGDGPTVLRSQIAALRAKMRRRGTLWRKRLDDEAVREWKTARLLRMSQPQVVQDRVFKATVTLEFETAMANWHAESASTFSGSASTGSPLYLLVENQGATVSDAVMTVTRTGGAIDFVMCQCADLGIAWSWSQLSVPLEAGDTLVVDAGTGEVAADAQDAYGFFSLFGSSPGFMTIESGNWVFEVTVQGGAADVVLSFYPQYE